MEELKYINAKTFKNTFCEFQEIDQNSITFPKWSYKSPSGSSYFYTKQGMYRYANHWGRLANCKWRLIPLLPEIQTKYKLGFATWESFCQDNNHEKLYYLQFDETSKSVQYYHKNNPNYQSGFVLRTSAETMKRIKQIRNILTLTNWSNHYEFEDLEVLRYQIVTLLIETEETLELVKKRFL